MAMQTAGNGAARWSALDVWPQVAERLLATSAAVGYVAVGAAAILIRSVTEVAGEALAWVLPGDDGTESVNADTPET